MDNSLKSFNDINILVELKDTVNESFAAIAGSL
jgi:hypothetical protein